MSATAVAYERHPEAFPQACGKFCWEDRSRRMQKRLRKPPSFDLADIMAEHGAEHRTEAERRRRAGRDLALRPC
eukprot:11104739-Alexandrium_andersonii.AAC.1